MSVCIFGLGEAGSAIASDIASLGISVAAFDPAPVATPTGVIRHGDAASAAARADLVLALTAASDCQQALRQALDSIPVNCLYADLATASPDSKRNLAEQAEAHGLIFADVALMAPVPGNGVRTPALASGVGAESVADALREFGMPIAVVDGAAGAAAAHKLVRSVVMKGLAGTLIESIRAAEALGIARPVWNNLVEQLSSMDEDMLVRLIEGTGTHHVRRADEMRAVVSLLESVAVDPVMTAASVRSLDAVAEAGVPTVPPQ